MRRGGGRLHVATLALVALLPGCATVECRTARGTAVGAPAPVASPVTPFLMFEGRAEEALDFYLSLFAHRADTGVESIERFGPDDIGPAGTLRFASVRLAGQRVRAFDSPPGHPFTFTPSISFFVECESLAEFERLHGRLSEQGLILMPPDDYGWSRRYSWVSDRFGVSWQLNLQ